MIETMLNMLFGCRHMQTTRPITPVHKPSDAPADTYVACLGCGKRFHYDTTNMRMGRAFPSPAASYGPPAGSFQNQH